MAEMVFAGCTVQASYVYEPVAVSVSMFGVFACCSFSGLTQSIAIITTCSIWLPEAVKAGV